MTPGGEAPEPGALAALPCVAVSRERPLIGSHHMIRAQGGAVLVADDPSEPAELRARRFLASFGSLVGIDALDRTLMPVAIRSVEVDQIGRTHVRLAQTHEGLAVLGGQLIVHLDDRGVLGINGTWVANVEADLRDGVSPRLPATDAGAMAVAAAAKATGVVDLAVARIELAIYPTGMLRGVPGESRLAWSVELTGAGGAERHMVWIDATDGRALERYPLRADALHRVVHTPQFDPNNPNMFVARSEGQPPSLVPAVNNLYDFSGHTYAFFATATGRDSFDGAGGIMRTVYLVNQNCPNAYWDGSTTNYCPAFDLDDVVAHEWGHAYTQHTHNLIYAYQPGALNESYSDIWGETVDLLNGVDGAGGSNNAQPAPAGVRWAVGEDFGTGSGEYELLLRDMWDPDRLSSPGRVSSPNYHCDTSDQGGVHTNSGVSNHAYAMLVDGKTFNGVTVTGIGFTRAAHIYYRAMTVYQTPITGFAEHADALEASCADLIGVDLDSPPGAPDTGAITASDCAQVGLAMAAVEMRAEPPCGFEPMFDPDTPPVCPGAGTVFQENWSAGLGSWTRTSTGVTPDWPGFQWTVVSQKPEGQSGSAAFAIDSRAGTCAPGGDHSGRFTLDSPTVLAPAGGGRLEIRVDHYVETEVGFDGGNLLLSVNGGAFALVPQASYSFNGPKSQLDAAPPLGQNTNPKAGEFAWHGADEGEVTGSWGTTIVDLTGLVAGGNSFRLRLDFGIDGCNGVTGWYVGDVRMLNCPGP